MKVVVGLGNPGAKYQNTRHNIGFEVLAELAQRHGGGVSKQKFDADLVEIHFGGENLLLVGPLTYMNLSGRSVGPLVAFYHLPLDDLLVVCDDMNIPSGKLRLRGSGAAGGQKGLRDIIQHLGTEDFSRLRVGIGRPPGRMDAAAYVLGRFSKEEREDMDFAVKNAADGVERWVRDGLQLAMNHINAPDADKN